MKRVIWISLGLLWSLTAQAASDPLPSWRQGAAKEAVLAFVAAVTSSRSASFVPPEARLAVFDNDGTLWPEKPNFFAVLFAIHRIETLASAHPQWRHTEPFAKVLRDGASASLTFAEMMQLQEAAFGDSTPEQFSAWVRAWASLAAHPDLHRPYGHLAYVPMLELLDLLRSHRFIIAIDSGAEVEFLRGIACPLYGVPPFLVVGNQLRMAYEMGAEGPWLRRLHTFDEPQNDGAGKVINLRRQLGIEPILAVGNADNDLELLHCVHHSKRPHLAILLRHDDAAREFAYTTGATRVQAMARTEGMRIVSMHDDFAQLFAPPAASR